MSPQSQKTKVERKEKLQRRRENRMFKSQLSGKQYGPKVKPKRVIIETRHVVYKDRQGVVIGQGHETVRELVVGPDEEVPPMLFKQS